jgi:O-antigen ligase
MASLDSQWRHSGLGTEGVVPVGWGRQKGDLLFLAMVAVLPLHTVFLRVWISWKPFLVLLAILAGIDLREALTTRRWPWHQRSSVALGLLLAVAAIGLPTTPFPERFLRLFLALVAGGLLMLVVARRLSRPSMFNSTLRVVFWSAAVMAATGLLVEVFLLGAAGDGVINYLTGAAGHELALFQRAGKPAYLLSGFLALSNWHHDPGYYAAWGVLWATLALVASVRGLGTGRGWLDGVVIGGLWVTVVMAFSRTGWVGLLVATAATAVVVRRRVPGKALLSRLGMALASMVLILAALFAVDVENVGGDLDLQFAFRFQQGWDFLSSVTGLFSSSESFADRFQESEQRADVWPEYWRLFVSHPLLGAGLGVGWETNSAGQEPHNLFLQLSSEMGVMGVAAFGTLVVVVLAAGGGVVGGLALLAAFIPSFTQTVLFEPTWWFAAGIFLAGGHNRDGLIESPPVRGPRGA